MYERHRALPGVLTPPCSQRVCRRQHSRDVPHQEGLQAFGTPPEVAASSPAAPPSLPAATLSAAVLLVLHVMAALPRTWGSGAAAGRRPAAKASHASGAAATATSRAMGGLEGEAAGEAAAGGEQVGGDEMPAAVVEAAPLSEAAAGEAVRGTVAAGQTAREPTAGPACCPVKAASDLAADS